MDIFKRIWLLTRSELFSHLRSYWYYILLGLMPLIVISSITSQQSEANAVIHITDELNTTASRSIAAAISKEGYNVKLTDDYDHSRRLVRKDRIYAGLLIETSGNVRVCYAHTYHREKITETITDSINTMAIQHYQKLYRGKKLPRFGLDVHQLDLLAGTPAKWIFVLKSLLFRLWIIASILGMIAVVLSRDSFSRLTRKYYELELLIGKLIAVILLSLTIGGIMLLTAFILGLEVNSVSWLIVNVILTVFSGAITGILFGVIPLFFQASLPNTLLAGCFSIIIFSVLLKAVGGLSFPGSLLPETIHSISQWLPLCPLLRLTSWTTIAGKGLDVLVVQGLLLKAAVVWGGEFLGCWLLFKHV